MFSIYIYSDISKYNHYNNIIFIADLKNDASSSILSKRREAKRVEEMTVVTIFSRLIAIY